MGPFLEPLIRATIRILLAGSKNGSQFRSRFWSHFFTLFGMHFIAFFCTKQAQNFQNTISFLLASQGSLNMLHTWRQRQQPPHCVDHELFPTLWRPLQHLAKNLDNFEPRKQVCGRHGIWTANLPSLPEILDENYKNGQAHKNCCKSVWEIENRNGNPDNLEPRVRTSKFSPKPGFEL